MCYRNNTLLSTSAGRSLRERKKYMNWSPAEKKGEMPKNTFHNGFYIHTS